MTDSTHKIFKIVNYIPLLIISAYIASAIVVHPAFLIPAALYINFVFKFEHDQLYVYGRLYWILRKDSRILRAGIGTMHQTSSPWNKGRGIYIVLFKRCLQVGLCKPQQLTEESGILSAMQGRYLNLTPHEIGNWNAIPKGNQAGTTPS